MSTKKTHADDQGHNDDNSAATDDVVSFIRSYMTGDSTGMFRLGWGHGDISEPEPKESLSAAIERDLAALHRKAPKAWKGRHQEAPPPPPEMTDTYAVAHASAVKRCPHENARGTAYANGEYQCRDCGRYFTRQGIYD